MELHDEVGLVDRCINGIQIFCSFSCHSARLGSLMLVWSGESWSAKVGIRAEDAVEWRHHGAKPAGRFKGATFLQEPD
jgi:hypothetical protein